VQLEITGIFGFLVFVGIIYLLKIEEFNKLIQIVLNIIYKVRKRENSGKVDRIKEEREDIK